jgi:hypothetical protein
MRICIQARKDIRFGDELTCFYGLKYFPGDPNKRAKQTRKRRRYEDDAR